MEGIECGRERERDAGSSRSKGMIIHRNINEQCGLQNEGGEKTLFQEEEPRKENGSQPLERRHRRQSTTVTQSLLSPPPPPPPQPPSPSSSPPPPCTVWHNQLVTVALRPRINIIRQGTRQCPLLSSSMLDTVECPPPGVRKKVCEDGRKRRTRRSNWMGSIQLLPLPPTQFFRPPNSRSSRRRSARPSFLATHC